MSESQETFKRVQNSQPLTQDLGSKGEAFGHLGSRKTREIWSKTTKKPVNFISSINRATDGMKLIAYDLEGTGIRSDWTSAMLHQLEVIFEAYFTSFGAVAEGIFESNSHLARSGEANGFNPGFFSERRVEKT